MADERRQAQPAAGPAGVVRRGIREVLAATFAFWTIRPVDVSDRTRGYVVVPLPGWLACGACGGRSVHPREWQYHRRPGKPTVPFRCNVSVKCYSCAAVWIHGVAIPGDWWNLRPRTLGRWAGLLGGSCGFEKPIPAGGAGLR